jgi:methyl-accepting chemotaxis protein
MNQLFSIKIGTRLALGFGLVLFFSSGLLAMGLWGMSQMHRSTDFILNNKVASLNAATEMREQARMLDLVLHKLASPTLMTEVDNDKKHLTAILDTYNKSKNIVNNFADGNDRQQAILSAEEQYKKILELTNIVSKLAADGENFEAESMLKADFQQPHVKWVASLTEVAQQQFSAMKLSYDDANQDYQKIMASMVIVGLLILAIGTIAAWLITRTISIPIRNAGVVADFIAAGDLTRVINVTSTDEVGALLASLKTMQTNLSDAVEQIQIGTNTINQGAREIASGNADLSLRTESQASALQETAASMLELTSTVKQNADSAKQANQLVMSATSVAVKGGAVVGQVVATMSSIKESSQRIVDIIGVIDSIAFQTNILALNAAVEAARAGEQGRGFAVVASEVRNLAQRSASAAKDIKMLISDSVSKVDQGSKLVDEAGKTMTEIVTSVKYVANIMGEIVEASHEQNEGIQQINLAITHMDEMTQQNAALVEQAAAAAESMEQQAMNLAQVVNVFHIGNDNFDGDAQIVKLNAYRKRNLQAELATTKVLPDAVMLISRNKNRTLSVD